jgi:hypothetical protein
MDGSARHIPWKIGVVILLFLALPGCKRPAPVELVDEEIGSPEVELVNEPVPALLGMDDIDSTRLFPKEFRKSFGHMLISGSVYDGLFLHREATLARAIFFDRSSPVLNGRGDTVTYKTVDVGSLSLDGYALSKHQKRALVLRPTIDTLLGPQYSLLNAAGPGISYSGDHAYRWQNPQTALPFPIDITVTSPEKLVVTEPTPATKFSRRRNLSVKWRGGGDVVMVEISDAETAERPVPLMHLRIARNRGEAVIPSTILRMLPGNRPGFLFSFSSDRSTMQYVSGYPDKVLVQCTTSHNLYFQCIP